MSEGGITYKRFYGNRAVKSPEKFPAVCRLSQQCQYISGLNGEIQPDEFCITKYPLAHGDSIVSPIGDIVVVSTNFTILALLRLRREKGKKGETKRKHQGCDVAKVIDTVERAVSTAKKVYRVIEPVVNAFTNRPKIK